MKWRQYYLRLFSSLYSVIIYIENLTDNKVRNWQQNLCATPYLSSNQSSSCKGACTDVIRFQTHNDFCCFPSVTFASLHYLSHLKVFLRWCVTLTRICFECFSQKRVTHPRYITEPIHWSILQYKPVRLHTFLANVNSRSRSLYAIARPSVVCRLSVVCNVRAPYSGGSNFRQYFYGIRYLGHPWTSTENFTEIVPGEPLRRGSWTQEG